jgi:hypothetical protein
MRGRGPHLALVPAMLAILLCVPSPAIEPEAPAGVVSIDNEFIRIRVNAGSQETGRFAVDTTGGDPSRSSDDDKILIYGRREPWTSYTALLVDGEPYIFGGPTERRAGLGAPTGAVTVSPHVSDDHILCTVAIGDLEVTQDLSFARSPTTRVEDAARISYRIVNRGELPYTVGLRVMLDTMLGSNDGAPLRAGDRAIATATQLIGEDIPDYWQAFDSLGDPVVISQGTLRGPGTIPPDHIEMVDWGTLADSPWEFPFPSGADFTRRGEAAQDTAVALYWHPAVLPPGESRVCSTLYGIGGVTLSPAQLSLGLTAPAEVDYRYDEEGLFSVTAYAENSGGFDSRGTVLALQPSEGLEIAEGNRITLFGLLRAGQTRQVTWRLRPTGKVTGMLQIAATITSENLEPNRVVRDIIVNSPPQLSVMIAAPNQLAVTRENRYSPNPFAVSARVTNEGAQPARSLVASLSFSDGLALTGQSQPTLVADRIEPGENITFNWQVRALGLPTGELPFSVRATAAGAHAVTGRHTVGVPRLTPELRVHPADQTVPELTDGQPTLVPVAVKVVPARQFLGARLSLTYDPTVLEPLYLSRGEAFVHDGRLLSPWSQGRTQLGRIADIGGERRGAPVLNAAEVTLFTVVFMVKAPGETAIMLASTSVSSADRESADHRTVGGRITVRPTEEIR